jgi:hypothetical protein
MQWYLKGLSSPLKGYEAVAAGMGFLVTAQSRKAAHVGPSHVAT